MGGFVSSGKLSERDFMGILVGAGIVAWSMALVTSTATGVVIFVVYVVGGCLYALKE
jgi:hypothetical protein